MKKIRLVWMLTGLAALVAVALVLFLPRQNDLSVAQVKQLPEGQALLINIKPGIQSVHKGDAFPYLAEVLYDPSRISDIDRDSFADSLNLEPFEIRNIEEKEFDLDPGTRVYRIQYEIQLISGEVEHLYEFPSITVRYKPIDDNGFAEVSIVPKPVYVTPRLPADVGELQLGFHPANWLYPLSPLEGEIEDASQSRLPWIFWSLGGLLAALAVVDLRLRVIPQWKERAKQERRIEEGDALCQAYRSLHKNVAAGAEPRNLLYQMNHILRLALVRKEGVGWLEEPDLDLVPDEIRSTVIALFDKCKKARGIEEMAQEEVKEALRQLEGILEFYFAGEMEKWKA